MMAQKPSDQLIRNFRIVAVLIGICLAYSMYTWGVIIYKMLVSKGMDIPLVIWLSMIVMVAGVIGYVQFLASGYIRSKLLRLFLFYSCFTNLVAAFTYSVLYFSPKYTLIQEPAWIIRIAVTVVGLSVADFISLALLQKARVPKITIEQVGEDSVNSFHPVNYGYRLVHRILDVMVAIFIGGSCMSLAAEYFPTNRSLVIAGLCASFVYYLVMETIFKVTFGKILTNSIVVNKKGEKISLARGLLRAFCRFIPFDDFSFAGVKGWHDQLSGTYVIHDRYEWENEADAFDTYFTGEPESDPTTTLLP